MAGDEPSEDASVVSSDDRPDVDFVEPGQVRPLRGEVLRPGRPPGASVLPGDDDPRSRHAAIILDGAPVAVGSILPEAPPWAPERRDSWRLRGMATRDGMRSSGLGSVVIGSLLEHARRENGRFIWCAARIGAQSFYERFGFATRGERFMTEGVEHIYMWRDLLEAPTS